ncbi:MAG: hypothetical protein ABEJ31_07485 [Haloarculaceae archaeon]
MGFSVSGSAAIIFAGMFIGFGMLYGATANSFERVSDAQDARTNGIIEARNGGVAIHDVTYANGTLTVTVNNTGSTALSLNATDLLVNGTYVGGWQSSATVDGDGTTDLWLPGEQLTITVARSSAPTRVRVVSETGIRDTWTGVA